MYSIKHTAVMYVQNIGTNLHTCTSTWRCCSIAVIRDWNTRMPYFLQVHVHLHVHVHSCFWLMCTFPFTCTADLHEHVHMKGLYMYSMYICKFVHIRKRTQYTVHLHLHADFPENILAWINFFERYAHWQGEIFLDWICQEMWISEWSGTCEDVQCIWECLGESATALILWINQRIVMSNMIMTLHFSCMAVQIIGDL